MARRHQMVSARRTRQMAILKSSPFVAGLNRAPPFPDALEVVSSGSGMPLHVRTGLRRLLQACQSCFVSQLWI